MATTYKITHGAATDGVAYIDLPISGRITSIAFTGYIQAGAGAIMVWTPEVSRVAVNQVATNNPRGVIAQMAMVTQAVSVAKDQNMVVFPDEPVKSGERLYLNGASTSGFNFGQISAFITIA